MSAEQKPSIETVFISGNPVLKGINGGGHFMFPPGFLGQKNEDEETFMHLVPNWAGGMGARVSEYPLLKRAYLDFFKVDGGAQILGRLVLRRDQPIKIKGKIYLPPGDIWHGVFDKELSKDVSGIFLADHLWRGTHNVLLTFISPEKISYSAMYNFAKLRPIFDRDMTTMARERLIMVSANYLRTMPK